MDLLLGLRGWLLLWGLLGLPTNSATQHLLTSRRIVYCRSSIRVHKGLTCVWVKKDASRWDTSCSFKWKQDVAGTAGRDLAPQSIL